MECRYCGGNCIKAGTRKNIQKYYCRKCIKYQQDKYSYFACCRNINDDIKLLIKEGCGMRSICRILRISMNTLLRRIKNIAAKVTKPKFTLQQQSFEVDELKTYISSKKKECWIIYSIESKTRKVIDFVVGSRNTENIKKIINTVLSLNPSCICTDKLNIYPSLIPFKIHKAGHYRTNRIERKNLSLRTHLKRLSRKTICYSKKKEYVEACVKIYCWG